MVVVVVAVAGATCPVYLGTGTPQGAVRGQSEHCCKGMGLYSPPSPCVFSGWGGGGGCFSVELLLPPPTPGL